MLVWRVRPSEAALGHSPDGKRRGKERGEAQNLARIAVARVRVLYTWWCTSDDAECGSEELSKEGQSRGEAGSDDKVG